MDILRRAFRDISATYTRGTILGRPAIVRHLNYADQIAFDEKRTEFYEYARKMGTETDEQALTRLKKDGRWTDAQDKELKAAKSFIASLREGQKKHSNMPSMVKSYAVKVADAEKDYEAKALVKRRLMGLTCEVAADREVNDYYIVSNLFSDSAMKKPLFDMDEFDYLRDDGETGVGRIVEDYNTAIEGCSEPNIKKLAMQPFFQRYFQLTGDSFVDFFDCAICDLTFYQVDLLRFCAHFRSLYQSHDISKFPPNVLEDPDLLTDYASAAVKGKEDLTKQGAYEPGAVVVGMKTEDAKVLGVTQKDPMAEIMSAHGGNLMEWAKKQG